MDATITINQISKDIANLDYVGKLDVLSRVVSMLVKPETKPAAIRLSDLKGLGKEIWCKYDVDAYIEKERALWD
jgi:plasmid maintenance system antidote protein VapI